MVPSEAPRAFPLKPTGFRVTKSSLSRHTRHKPPSKDPGPAQVSPGWRPERLGGFAHSQGWRDWTGGRRAKDTRRAAPGLPEDYQNPELHRPSLPSPHEPISMTP